MSVRRPKREMMESYEAARAIVAEFPFVDAHDCNSVIMDEAEDTMEHYKLRNFLEAVPTVLANMQGWFRSGHEWAVDIHDPLSIASFLASHRRAVVWAVLLAKVEAEKQAQAPKVSMWNKWRHDNPLPGTTLFPHHRRWDCRRELLSALRSEPGAQRDFHLGKAHAFNAIMYDCYDPLAAAYARRIDKANGTYCAVSYGKDALSCPARGRGCCQEGIDDNE